ncbi:hypothetical protein GWL_32540 [Herbaspirillum sp. GW103]|nr:hypothetical protein GWL_32540 [Herbaspirillum sp. GW103]
MQVAILNQPHRVSLYCLHPQAAGQGRSEPGGAQCRTGAAIGKRQDTAVRPSHLWINLPVVS